MDFRLVLQTTARRYLIERRRTLIGPLQHLWPETDDARWTGWEF